MDPSSQSLIHHACLQHVQMGRMDVQCSTEHPNLAALKKNQ